MSELNERQRRFCQELLKGKSNIQAAISAGYSATSAAKHADRMLKKDNIRQYMAHLSKRVEDKAIMSGSEVLEMLTKIAKKAPKANDCLTALNMLGKHHKLFTEMHEHEHNFNLMPTITRGGKPVKLDIGKPKPQK